jgi:hypothetical protein
MVAAGTVNQNVADSIIKAKDQTFLQEKFRKLSAAPTDRKDGVSDARHVFNYATPEEQASLINILLDKEAREAEKQRKVQEALADPERAEIKRAKAARAKQKKQMREDARRGAVASQ